MTKNFLALIATSLFAASTLAGCALEGDACSADADCEGGFKCVVPAVGAGEPAEDGTCNTECATNADCATGFDCNVAEAICVTSSTPPPPACTTDAQCAGAYACDTDGGGACFTACTTGAQCKDDAQCTDTVCETVAAIPFTQVAVLSEVTASSNDVTGTTTPGADIDSIELISGATTLQAATVAAYAPGAVGDRGNNAADRNTVLGARDSMTGNGPQYACDVDRNYLALGANDGFVAVTFPGNAEITDGAQIKVWELADQDCSNSLPNRDDSYSVYIAEAGTSATTAAGIRAGGGWCSLGSKAGGGIGTFTVTLANCN